MLQITMLSPPREFHVEDVNDGNDDPDAVRKVFTVLDTTSPIPIVIPLTKKQAEDIGSQLRRDKLNGLSVVRDMPATLTGVGR